MDVVAASVDHIQEETRDMEQGKIAKMAPWQRMACGGVGRFLGAKIYYCQMFLFVVFMSIDPESQSPRKMHGTL